ncbi:RteC domain-containing protein [Jejuia pallidilutea]|nr:RteC domain-containing protein [Jejuia pallidilutea]
MKCNEAIVLSRKLLSEFRKEISTNGFKSITEEITFFKNYKQIPFSYLIYYSKIYAFESEFSKVPKVQRQSSIDKFRNKAYQFLMRHIDFVNYIEQGQTHLDIPYFTRGQSVQIMMMHTDDNFYDLDFNTSHDHLLAKVLASKRFIDYLENRLHVYPTLCQKSTLQWTSSKVALTELIYALYHSNTINYGNTDIKEIADVMQKLFNCELGDFYKVYSEIRNRKKSKTKFLDELSMQLIHAMDKIDS